MIPRMLDDMFKIVLDPLFGTVLANKEVSAEDSETGLPCVLKYPVEGYEDHENMFELICSPPMPTEIPVKTVIWLKKDLKIPIIKKKLYKL